MPSRQNAEVQLFRLSRRLEMVVTRNIDDKSPVLLVVGRVWVLKSLEVDSWPIFHKKWISRNVSQVRPRDERWLIPFADDNAPPCIGRFVFFEFWEDCRLPTVQERCISHPCAASDGYKRIIWPPIGILIQRQEYTSLNQIDGRGNKALARPGQRAIWRPGYSAYSSRLTLHDSLSNTEMRWDPNNFPSSSKPG